MVLNLKPRKENNMLFRYKNKVYVRPFANKIVEVIISKNGNEYDIQPTDNKIEITPELNEELYSISNEEAYKLQNGSKKEKNSRTNKLFEE